MTPEFRKMALPDAPTCVLAPPTRPALPATQKEPHTGLASKDTPHTQESLRGKFAVETCRKKSTGAP